MYRNISIIYDNARTQERAALMHFLTHTRRWLERAFSLRTLYGKFMLGFTIASVLAVGNVLVVESLLRQSDTLAATVNTAGKMRMLSQRIGLMQLAAQGPDATARADPGPPFEELEASFESALRALRTGGEAFGFTLHAVDAQQQQYLEKIEASWKTYRRVLETMRSDPSGTPGSGREAISLQGAAAEMVMSSGWLLDNTEALMKSLVDQSQVMQEHVMHKIYGLFAVNALMLLLAWVIVSTKVLKPIKRLMHLSNEVSAGNYSARLHLDSNDEFGELGRVLDKASQHVEDLLRDIDAKKNALKQTELKLRRAALVYQNISDGVVVTDSEGYVQDVNPAFSLITGYHADEIIGHRMNKLGSGRHAPEFFQALWHKLHTTGHWNGDIWNRHKSGDTFVSHVTITSCRNDDGSVNCRIGLFSDVTERRKQEAMIWRQARFDHLTQLPNRQMFHENLQQSIRQSQRSGLPFALIFLDLDLFKEVNDTFGHDEGDILLQRVAQRIKGCCRGSDQVARLGGDEFIMIIQDIQNPDDIHPICNKILQSISRPYKLTVSEVRISCSVGVAFYPADADNPVELLKYADLAMYAAKEMGRNRYCLFSSAMRDSVQLRYDLLRDLLPALDSGQFVLFYQPIVDLRSGRVAKVEALVRWKHPEHGMVSPADFIPLAEDSGSIVPLGEYVFRQALRQLSSWRDSLNEDLAVSVNVSPVQFQRDGLNAESWVQALEDAGLPGSALTVEITERLLMDIKEGAAEKLRALRDAGIQIALDDFGTGYSSISYLRRFNIDVIKIDQGFVRSLTEDSENMALCRAIITMSHQLGLKVVAEGIECAQQRDLLLAAGCDYGQGYWYSKPLNAELFASWLENQGS